MPVVPVGRRARLAVTLCAALGLTLFPVERAVGQEPLGDAGDAETVPVQPTPTGGDVRWTPGPVDELVWAAGALQRVLSERDYPSVLLVSALSRLVEVEGPAALDRAAPLLAAITQGQGVARSLERCRAAADPVDGALCALEQVMPFAPGPLARQLTEEGARLVALTRGPGAGGGAGGGTGPAGLLTSAASVALGNWLPALPTTELATWAQMLPGALDPFQHFAEQALEGAWRLALTGEGGGDLAGPLGDFLGNALGFHPRDGVQSVLARAPELRQLLALHPLLGLDGASLPTRAGVESGYRGFLDGVVGSVKDAVAGALLDGEGRSLVPTSLAGAERQAADWALQRSYVYLASRGAELAGDDAGVVGRIRAVGNAAVELRKGAGQFPAQLASLGQQAAMLALGGNVLSVATQLTSFFGVALPGGLGGDAAREVRVVRAAVDTLRQELHGRFDRVDASLDSVLGVLDTRFGRLEQLVAVGNQNSRVQLASLHLDVLALGRRVERMEDNLQLYMQAGFDRDYTRAMILCLEHRERLLPPFDQMDFPTFSSCLTDFRARAVRDARDALLTDQTTLVDDASLLQALADTTTANLARRLTLLGRVAEQRFAYPALRGGRGLANPFEWAVATQAYLTMLQDWPEHARSVSPGDLEAMRAAGTDLEQVLSAISVEPGTGASGDLLRRVLAYYDANVAELARESDVLAHRHQQAQLRRVAPESLLPRMTPVDGNRPTLAVPRTIAAQVPQEVRTAGVLALGEPSLVYSLASEDSVSRENVRRRLLIFGKRHDRLTFTRTRVDVELRFGAHGVVATWAAEGPMVLRQTEEMGGDERSENVRGVRQHVADPGAYFLANAWPALAAAPSAWRGTPPRAQILTSLEIATQAELRRHASVALENVFATVCAAGGESARLDAADAGSAERIRGALGGMAAARVLLEGYTLLGLSGSARSDGRLAAALFGPEAVLDHAALCAAVAIGESPLRLIWLDDEPGRRSTVLAGALDAVLARPEALPEGLPLVQATLQRLEAALRLQRLRATAARAGE